MVGGVWFGTVLSSLTRHHGGVSDLNKITRVSIGFLFLRESYPNDTHVLPEITASIASHMHLSLIARKARGQRS